MTLDPERLRRAIARCVPLTDAEVWELIQHYRDGNRRFGPTSLVNAYGGPLAVIRAAIRLRHTLRGSSMPEPEPCTQPGCTAAQDAPGEADGW